jgi:hypothetical protein
MRSDENWRQTENGDVMDVRTVWIHWLWLLSSFPCDMHSVDECVAHGLALVGFLPFIIQISTPPD